MSILGLALVAGAARVPTLAAQSFWLDEAYTERLVRMSFGGMLHAIPISESTPPLYYILAWFWTRLFGYSEFGIRSLSALAGILTVPVVYALVLRLANRRAALIAGALVALSPLLIWYSQEARAYALATLLSTVSLACFAGFLDTGASAWLMGWTASSSLGLTAHYFVAFVVAPELVWLGWRYRRDKRALVAGALVLAAVLALVPLALAQRGTGHADYIAQGSLTTRLLQVPKQFLTGYATPSQVITSVLAALLAGFGVLRALGSARPGAMLAFRQRRCLPGERTLIPLVVGLACVLVPAGLALVGVDFLDTRNVLPALPPLLVVVAIGFALAGRASAIALTGSLAVVFAVAVALVDANPRYQRDDWRGASQALGADRRSRAIVVTPGSGSIALAVYQPGLRPLRRATVTELDVVAIPPQVLGGGIGPPPRPPGPPPVPAGFRLTHVAYASTYTALRFTAARPVSVTPAVLASSHLGTGPATDLIQQARRPSLR